MGTVRSRAEAPEMAAATACALLLMDGLEATRRIRRLPGHAFREHSDKCLEAGMDGSIPTLVLLEGLPPASF